MPVQPMLSLCHRRLGASCECFAYRNYYPLFARGPRTFPSISGWDVLTVGRHTLRWSHRSRRNRPWLTIR